MSRNNLPGSSLFDAETFVIEELTKLLYADLPKAIAANIFVSATIAYVLWGPIPPATVIAWLALMGAGLAARVVMARPYLKADSTGSASPDAITGLRKFRLGVAIIGASWGLTGIMLFHPSDVTYQLFLAFALIGLSAGAAASLSADLRSALLFITPSIIILIVQLLLQGRSLPVTMGIMAMIYLVYLLVTTRRLGQNIRRTAELRLSTILQNMALQTSETRWRFAIDGSGLGLWDWNIATDDVFYSARLKEMLGYDGDEKWSVLDDWRKRIHPDDKARVLADLQHHFRGESFIFDSEYRLLCKSGSYNWVHSRGKIMESGESGEPLRMLGTNTDISRRKRIEAELISYRDHLEERVVSQTAEAVAARVHAERANQAKSAFLASMSHEIRTPMNGVIGMVDVLINTPLDERQNKMAQIIRDSAYTQLSILNDILDFSKIEAGMLELSPEPFSLLDVVRDTCALIENQAAQKNTRLTWSADPQIPAVLDGDELRMRQVLTNIVSNAIKFSSGLGRPGQIDVQARVTEAAEHRVWVEISVRDNGIGMDEATLGRLFQSFQQADASTTRRYGGTGLGLVISRRLMAMMGGEIRVESVLGAGSTFTLHIPFDRVDAAAPPAIARPGDKPVPAAANLAAPTREDALRQGRLILVAEDNETNQEVIREQLGVLGFVADIAVDGLQAFDRWMTGDYALLLSDVHMPNMDGYQLTAAIRAEEAKSGRRRTPVVALTANALKGEAHQCRAAGMDDYISKPAQLPELGAMLHKWLDPAQPSTAGQSSESGDIELPVWDAGTLARMVGDNPAMHRRLLEKFLANARERITQILAAAEAANFADVGNMAHALKSAARTVGAMQLGDLCQKLETAGKTGDGTLCNSLAIRLNETFDAVAQNITKGASR